MRLLTGYTFYLVFWGLCEGEPGYSSRKHRGVGIKSLGGSAIPCKGVTTREAGEQRPPLTEDKELCLLAKEVWQTLVLQVVSCTGCCPNPTR